MKLHTYEGYREAFIAAYGVGANRISAGAWLDLSEDERAMLQNQIASSSYNAYRLAVIDAYGLGGSPMSSTWWSDQGAACRREKLAALRMLRAKPALHAMHDYGDAW